MRHQQQARARYDEHRGSAHARGYGSRWRSARLAYLIAHPLCVLCLRLGVSVGATLVDHSIPHRGDQGLFWDRDNWQSLCAPCHNAKTAREDGGFGNRLYAGPP